MRDLAYLESLQGGAGDRGERPASFKTARLGVCLDMRRRSNEHLKNIVEDFEPGGCLHLTGSPSDSLDELVWLTRRACSPVKFSQRIRATSQ